MRYRLQRHDGTDCSATMVPITVLRMVPIQRYRQKCFTYLTLKGLNREVWVCSVYQFTILHPALQPLAIFLPAWNMV